MDTKTIAQSIGAAFRAARARRGLTCVQAAELLCLQIDFYGRIEAGESLPTILTCARAVEVLGVDPFALFGTAASTVDVAPRYVAECADYDRRRADTCQAAAHADRLARDAAEARAESLAAECEALQRELGRVRAEREEAREEASEWAHELVDARDRIDALEAERETLLLIAKLRDEDPDEHPDQLRLSLGTGLTPAGPVICTRAENTKWFIDANKVARCAANAVRAASSETTEIAHDHNDCEVPR